MNKTKIAYQKGFIDGLNSEISIKEMKVYEVLKDFSKKNKQPTMRIMKEELKKRGFEVKSLNSIFQYYNQLEKKGYIKINRYYVEINN